MPRAEQELVVNTSIDRLFAVIVDYERYPEFLPDMKQVTVLSRQDGVSVVRFELELIMRLAYTLRLIEDAPASISWTLEEARMMASNVGGWRLEALDENRTKAIYGLELKLRGLIPKSVSTRLIGSTLPETLHRFKDRAEELVE